MLTHGQKPGIDDEPPQESPLVTNYNKRPKESQTQTDITVRWHVGACHQCATMGFLEMRKTRCVRAV